MMKLSSIANEKVIIGIMTGTSLDSVDTALCKFELENGTYKFTLLNYNEFEINQEIRELIFRIINNQFTIKELSQLNFYLAYLFADCSQKVCKKINYNFDDVDLISIHGQTLWHNPTPELFADKYISSTLQLTSISALSALVQKEVIGDFRAADVALGGQGAPLVPIFDFHFLKNENENIVALNIGGISNITIMPKNCNIDELIAFDTGPGNMLIDIVVKKFYGKSYDKNGEFAKSGKIIQELFDELKKIEFTYLEPPKSTGRELFNEQLLDSCLNSEYLKEDIIRTLTEFTAFTISINIEKFAPIGSKVIISGGGRKNTFLIQLLNENLINYKVINIDEIGINGDAKEAICFAFLGYLNKMNKYGNVKEITGAKKSVVLGLSANSSTKNLINY